MADFSKAIESLRKRSVRARRVFGLILTMTSFVVIWAFGFVAIRYVGILGGDSTLKSFADMRGWERVSSVSPDLLFATRIAQVLDDAYGPTPTLIDVLKNRSPSEPKAQSKEDAEANSRRLDFLLAAYERTAKIKTERDTAANATDSRWLSVLSNAVVSVGAVALAVLLLQIVVSFMRYYARLAEIYDAQADALAASEGDAEMAYRFIEKFSPLAIDFGKPPQAMSEKAVEAVVELAKKVPEK